MALQRLSGVLAHPTSLPGRYGIGDLGEGAYLLIDFLYESKQKMWQVLPLGPTSFGDSPYQSFSTFAGNHYLISPDILVKEGYLTDEDLAEVPAFDELSTEYGRVIEYKMELFRTAYKRFAEDATAEQKSVYDRFCQENAAWLDDYSLFVAIKSHFIAERKYTYESEAFLRFQKKNEKLLSENAVKDYFYGAVWTSWPDELARRDKAALVDWQEKLIEDIGFTKFLQYEFDREWAEVKQYANGKGISVIGDIPIFVAMDSSDAWANPELFFLDEDGTPSVVAGVPPDYFSEDGQLWGNPLYNWPVHQKSGYSWWIDRIQSTLRLVDFLRIDHFRGFESYWAVPYGEKTAINGTWKKGPGRDFFDALEKRLGELPIIAEDLGIITEEVTELRQSLQLPGMLVLQFAFDTGPDNIYLPHNFVEANSVIYTGTHDNDTITGWYEKADEKAKDHFRRYLDVNGDNAAWDMIRLAWSSSAAVAVVPMQDLMRLGSESRMNTPGVAAGNWQFRFTEEMLRQVDGNRLSYITELFNRTGEKKLEEPDEAKE